MAQSSEHNETKPDVASSLAVSTRRFVDGLARRCLGHLLEGHQVSQPIDYFKLADELGIQRRRVYDIINVLEGMRLVAKSSKGRLFCSPVLAYAAAVRAKLDAIIADTQRLVEYEHTVDNALESAEAELAALMGAASDGDSQIYVTADDVANLPMLQDMSAVGIALPKGGSISASSLPSASSPSALPSSSVGAAATTSAAPTAPSTAAAGSEDGQSSRPDLPYRLLVAAAAPPPPKKGVKGGSRRASPSSSESPSAAGTLDDISAFLIAPPLKPDSSETAAPEHSTDSLLALVQDGVVGEGGVFSAGGASNPARSNTQDGDNTLNDMLADERSSSDLPTAGPSLAALDKDTAPPVTAARRKGRRGN